MNINKIRNRLETRYPGRRIVITDPVNPTEILCEVEPTEEHLKWSAAVAIIDSTRLHYHNKLTEVYHILSGQLDIYLNDKKYHMEPGDYVEIPPNTKHYSVGDETWVYVYSRPGWTPEDHILKFDGQEISRKKV